VSTVIEMPRLTVRPATAADVDAVADLVHRLWHETYATHVSPEAAAGRTLAGFRAEVEAQIRRAWVASLGERVIGFCAVSANCVEDLWVAARYRRRGIGSQLLAAAMADLSERGYRAAQAGCEDFNRPARAFLERHGWRVIGEEPQPRTPAGQPVRALVYSRAVPVEPVPAA
jgi:ribosomal protein S18 acetylase RimI-like enzyme